MCGSSFCIPIPDQKGISMKTAAESRFPRSVNRLQVATRGKELTDHTDRCILAYAAQLDMST